MKSFHLHEVIHLLKYFEVVAHFEVAEFAMSTVVHFEPVVEVVESAMSAVVHFEPIVEVVESEQFADCSY